MSYGYSKNYMGSKSQIPQAAKMAGENRLICYNNDFMGSPSPTPRTARLAMLHGQGKIDLKYYIYSMGSRYLVHRTMLHGHE
jgi:proline racemase